MISERTAKVLLATSENNYNFNSFKLSCKFACIPFMFFPRNQNQKSNFSEVGGLVTKNISGFLFTTSHALLLRHVEFNRLFDMNFILCCSCSFIVSGPVFICICYERYKISMLSENYVILLVSFMSCWSSVKSLCFV